MKYVRLFYVVMLVFLTSGCATVGGDYVKRENRRWYQSEYKKVPKVYVSGGAGSIKLKDGTEYTRAKRPALIDIGGVINSTNPSAEVK